MTLKCGAILLCVFLVGCSSSSDPSQEVVVGTGDGLFPAALLTDWVSYAVQVSRVRVLRERELPSPETLKRGEGYIAREVTLSVMDTFWTSPGASSPGATNMPTELAVLVQGWILRQGNERHLFAIPESPRIEVDGVYVMPLVNLVIDARLAWGPLSTDAVFASAGDAVAMEDVRARGTGRVAKGLSGMSDAELTRTFAETPPDPLAQKYFNLPPLERLAAVQMERGQ